MKKIGITGRNGFVGYHLYQTLKLYTNDFEVVDFDREWFDDAAAMDAFTASCDVIVHLAALNRHADQDVIYDKNITLVNALTASLERVGNQPHVLMSSSTQEERDNLYGKSKKEGRERLAAWAQQSGALFTGMVIPNVFGPFGHPFYNSVVATFCHQVARGQQTTIQVDGELKLIYVGEVVSEIIRVIKEGMSNHSMELPHTSAAKVSTILARLLHFREIYQERGEIPALENTFDFNLFNTYRCYMELDTYFPRKFVQHTDPRGSFVEIIRLGIGGQVSFSTTVPGIVRGNHFHTRKIERFAVIKGKALIQLRRVGTDEVLEFYLDGDEPAYVDMPIWYTHNIKNIGDDVLYTNFWINEPYNPADADTWMLTV